MSKIIKLAITIGILGFSLLGHAELWGTDWKLFSLSGGNSKTIEDIEGTVFYDAESITRPSKDIVRVWINTVLTETGKIKMAKQFGTKFEKARNDKILYEINCADKMIHPLQMGIYSEEGDILYSRTSTSTEDWQFIVPETVGENLYKIVYP